MAPYERLPSNSHSPTEARGWWRPKVLLITSISLFVVFIFWSLPDEKLRRISQLGVKDVVESWCPLPEKPKYPSDGLKPSSLFADKSSVDKQVTRLSAAVNVPTVSWDDNEDVGVDKRWQPFYRFHEVLEELFPLVYVEGRFQLSKYFIDIIVAMRLWN
jgi:Gly-Xaa carboxypeptidase